MVSTDSPLKRGRGVFASLFEAQSEPVLQLPWHEGIIQASKISYLSGPSKKDHSSLWMGNYLNSDRSFQLRYAYFKPEDASSTLYPARVNANLGDFSDGPLKDKIFISLSEQEEGAYITSKEIDYPLSQNFSYFLQGYSPYPALTVRDLRVRGRLQKFRKFGKNWVWIPG